MNFVKSVTVTKVFIYKKIDIMKYHEFICPQNRWYIILIIYKKYSSFNIEISRCSSVVEKIYFGCFQNCHMRCWCFLWRTTIYTKDIGLKVGTLRGGLSKGA